MTLEYYDKSMCHGTNRDRTFAGFFVYPSSDNRSQFLDSGFRSGDVQHITTVYYYVGTDRK